ncbi:MAG: hypothetical protein V1804_04335 [Patescibacteria group bacterium]
MIPDSKNSNPSPSSAILAILSQKPRLPIKDLYEFFLKKYQPGMSLQGFYKLTKHLVQERILVKEGHLLSIDASWIHNLVNFTEILKKTYFSEESSKVNVILEEGENKQFVFEKVNEMDNFWTHALILITQYVQNQKDMDKDGYSYNEHCWFQLVKTSQEQFLADVYQEKEMKLYMLCRSDSFLDSITPKLISMKELHFAVDDKKSFPKNYYCMTIGDFIIETSLPNYIYELIEKIYENTKDLSQFNMETIVSLINQPGRTTFIISRDKKRAEEFRKNISEHFKTH